MALDRTVRIGTRGSKLARWQSDWVAAQLTALGARVEIIEIATQGDVQQQGSVVSLGIQGLFTKEIQAAALSGQVDVAVHSLKDLPTQQVAGLRLAATPPREDPADALISNIADSLDTLPQGARVGTGSLRRRAQLLHLRPDLNITGIRGNVDTRLRKLDDGEYDAIVLAAAGLRRLGWGERITALLGPPQMLPAPGQGSLGIECRADDADSIALVGKLDDPATRLGVTAERIVLAALHGGCSAPIAAWGRMTGGQLLADALVADVNGTRVLRASGSIDLPQSYSGSESISAAEQLGYRVAEDLLSQGAAALIETARQG
ncbi:MAG: hydroxymethylbilane synthase [Pirellulales bacterium]|nr:hydroxymethylbilane synthase [Pirellulales bacterium]